MVFIVAATVEMSEHTSHTHILDRVGGPGFIALATKVPTSAATYGLLHAIAVRLYQHPWPYTCLLLYDDSLFFTHHCTSCMSACLPDGATADASILYWGAWN